MSDGFKTSIAGSIPEDWKALKLADLVEFQNGKAHENYISDNGVYKVVNSKFISTNGHVFKLTNEPLTPLRKGCITMVMSDIPNGRALSKCYVIPEDNAYTLNQRICSLSVKQNVDARFLFYSLNRNRYYLSFDNGVAQTNLKKEEVLNCPLAVPSIKEQIKIADILSTVDEKIEVIEEQIAETQQLKKGLMQRLLTKGIGHTKFKDSPLGDIPESWEVVDFELILSEEKNSLGYGILQPDEGGEDGVPMLRTVDLNETGLSGTEIIKVSRAMSQQFSKTVLRGGEVLLSVMGTLGRTVVVPEEWKGWNLNRALAVIRLNDRILNTFLCQYFKSPNFKRVIETQSLGSAQMRINLNDLRTYKIPLPPKEEQSRISDILFVADEKLDVLNEKKLKFQDLKKSLMQTLLTGKIRVNNLVNEMV